MFAKVFAQIFDSTIAEDYRSRHIFMDLLVMADSDGVVDRTPESISRVTNVPLSEVQAAITVLSQPDAKSRTKDHDGRRIQLIDTQRDWGWVIINYQKYREIRDEEARRIANRSYKRDQRKRDKLSAQCPDSQQRQPLSANAEGEAEAEEEAKGGRGKRPSPQFSQVDFDERDMRKIAESRKKLDKKFQVGSDTEMTNGQYFAAIAEDTGLSVQRILALLDQQKKWPA